MLANIEPGKESIYTKKERRSASEVFQLLQGFTFCRSKMQNKKGELDLILSDIHQKYFIVSVVFINSPQDPKCRVQQFRENIRPENPQPYDGLRDQDH